MKINEDQWKSMKINENQWKLIKINEMIKHKYFNYIKNIDVNCYVAVDISDVRENELI